MYDGLETPFMFPETVSHRDHARKLVGDDIDRVISAGYCSFHINNNNGEATFNCFDRSTSLNLISRGGQDADVFNRMYYFQ